MTTWQAFLLGLIQGITEFLPISSSGHLALGQYLLGFEHLQDYVLFDLICHLGTLLAIFYVFYPLIKESITTHTSRFWQVTLGSLPLIPLVLILKPIKAFFDHPQLLGPCFLTTACLLYASLYWKFPFRHQAHSQRKWKDPLTIGLFQALAVLPGISRSGATISAARLLGWQKEQAVQFSFLLAIPAILGGSVLEGWKAWHLPAVNSAIHPWGFLVGFITSFIMGCFTLRMLIRLVIQDKWIYFAWYCLIIGIATTVYFNLLVNYAA